MRISKLNNIKVSTFNIGFYFKKNHIYDLKKYIPFIIR